MGIVDLFQRRGVITEERAEKFRSRAATPIEPKPKGITVADVVLDDIGGRNEAGPVKAGCRFCGGKIVERVWPDGRRDWGCHGCGRKA